MKAIHKRFAGRRWGAEGPAVLPPPPRSPVTYYSPSPAGRRSRTGRVVRVLAWALLTLVALVAGAAGGVSLWLAESVTALQAHSPAVRRAEKQLAVTIPGHAAIALLLGDNQRAGPESSAGGRSDTIMLIRADPLTKTISLFSIPRDLQVPVYCPGSSTPRATTRIDYAFSWCGPAGSLDTVRRLTGLPVNYLITVDFHGFKAIVNDLGGIWLDIDRRYFNANVGNASTDYSNINLQPGYQLLSGGSALAFVRFRHTDSDFYRVARQQEFLRALKDQVARSFDPLALPKIVSDITHNVEVGSKSGFSPSTVLGWALFAVTLPPGHILQDYVHRSDVTDVNVGGADELSASSTVIQHAVDQFVHPDARASRAANDAALGVKPKAPAAPSPQTTTVTVLNGNGVAGAAASASHLLAGRGYRLVLPPGGVEPNAPTDTYFHTAIYYDARQAGAKTAAQPLAGMLAPADVRALPASRRLLSLDPGSMLVVVLGQTFHGELVAPPRSASQAGHEAPHVSYDPAASLQLVRPLARRVPFPVEAPTVLEASSVPDTLPGDVPARLYWIDRSHKALRLVFVTGSREFWGVEETNLPNPPILNDRSFSHVLHGRRFQFYYAGGQLHMIVLREGTTSYWVVNTLLNTLSNKTMIAIARGLKPLARGT